MKTEKQKLQKLRKLLNAKSRWCKGVFARDKNNFPCYPESKRATVWCLMGACEKVGLEKPYSFFGESVLGMGIIAFNDDLTTTHKKVLGAIDAAIKKCET